MNHKVLHLTPRKGKKKRKKEKTKNKKKKNLIQGGKN